MAHRHHHHHGGRVRRFFGRLIKRIVLTVVLLLAVGLGLRVWDSNQGPPLAPWHEVVPAELTAASIDQSDWLRWMATEDAVFATVRAEVTSRLDPADQVPANRYFEGSPLYTPRFARDWNRSFILEPEGTPVGAVVLLHGLTDAPFSLRHVAEAYRARGFVAIGMRMPGHGTVPAGLTAAVWEDWAAATRLAMREARRRVGADRPIQLVGYSNGGALALMHALDAAENPALPRAERVVLISPMVGVTAFARFAGLAGLPAMLPRFAHTAWLDIQPEYNPFKYNSFPVNAARQSWRLTAAVQERLRRLAASNTLTALPPILTFQSVADFTVSTRAVMTSLYEQLPVGGHEVVLFDINRAARYGPLLNPSVNAVLTGLGAPPRRYTLTVIGNAAEGDPTAVARRTEAGVAEEVVLPIDAAWPRDVFSLSHVALPFPVTDGLYGLDPDPADDFGARLGRLAPRGERGVLVVGADALTRLTSNPFFDAMLARIMDGVGAAR